MARPRKLNSGATGAPPRRRRYRRDLPEIVSSRPHCRCGSFDLICEKTIEQGDGSRLRYVNCAECGRGFRNRQEPVGPDDDDLEETEEEVEAQFRQSESQ